MTDQLKPVFLISIILILLSSCIKKDNLSIEEKSKESTENQNNIFVQEEQKESTDIKNESSSDKRDEFIELIKKINYPDGPDHMILSALKKQESFLEIEKRSDELLDYALDLYQDKILTKDDQWIIAYALLSVEIEKFKYFLRDLSKCYLEGKIDRYIVGFSFFPGYNKRVSENIHDPVIREAFEIVLKSDRGWPNDETKKSIINDLKRTAPN